ncbi:serine hydrolase [Hellea sp.]|nr:beta-lactamase family protein [Hellea sp.]MDC1062294.1 serine hydrolase [Hellea sp.]
MSTHKIISFFTVLLIAIFTLSASHIDKFSHVNMNEVDNLLNSAVLNKEVIGISALIYDEGSVIYKNSYGLRDRERKSPVETDTVWRIFSMTKPVTATIIMDLQEEKKLNLSDPVSLYIPEINNMKVAKIDKNGVIKFEPQNRAITLEDLMLHRSGMGYGIFGSENALTSIYENAELFYVVDKKSGVSESMEEKMTKLSKLPLLFQPGEAWYYSYSMDVLGRVAEVIEGKKLGEIMDERLFKPLGMKETSFGIKQEQQERFASNYFKTKEGNFVLIEDGQNSPFSNPLNEFQSGGAGLVSTIDDFSIFAKLMLDGGVYKGHRVLDEKTVNLMMEDHMGQDKPYLIPWLGPDFMSGFGYGGSVQIDETTDQLARNGKSIGHWGWSGAAGTIFWVDRKNNSFGILMLQFLSDEDPKIHDEFRALAFNRTKNE